MNIAIPVIDTASNKNTIAPGLNVNGCVCLYDCERNTGLWIKTLDLASNMGELLPALEQRSVSVVITGKIHPMALKVLVNKGFEVYRPQGSELDKNIGLYHNNALVRFGMDEAMDFATACGGACNTCSSDCDSEPRT